MIVQYEQTSRIVQKLWLDHGWKGTFADQAEYPDPPYTLVQGPTQILDNEDQFKKWQLGVPFTVNVHPTPTHLLEAALDSKIHLFFSLANVDVSDIPLGRIFDLVGGASGGDVGYVQEKAGTVRTVLFNCDDADDTRLEVITDPAGAAVVIATVDSGVVTTLVATDSTVPALTGTLSHAAGAVLGFRVKDPSSVGLTWNNCSVSVTIEPA